MILNESLVQTLLHKVFKQKQSFTRMIYHARELTITIALLLSFQLASAALLHGTVYDASLTTVSNAVVEITTIPKQVVVAANSTYSFSVQPGTYTLRAVRKSEEVNESITITTDGDYVHDLILFPALGDDLEQESFIDPGDLAATVDQKSYWWVAVLLVLAFGSTLFFAFKNKQQKKDVQETFDDVESQILAYVRKEGGRANQKDLRKILPLSEAKISLIIAQLEHEQKLQKIKKGRGNILILK